VAVAGVAVALDDGDGLAGFGVGGSVGAWVGAAQLALTATRAL
jgi:hypothetical protein